MTDFSLIYLLSIFTAIENNDVRISFSRAVAVKIAIFCASNVLKILGVSLYLQFSYRNSCDIFAVEVSQNVNIYLFVVDKI